ncbi:13557_t:CDS:10 [Entrophospora sp. SA101]|nr:13557_t:CDS:10 [Entrophospora sp. SA101]
MAAVAAVITTSFVRSPPPSPSSQPQLSPSTTVQNAATITATATTTINFGPATSDQKKNIVNDVLLSECIMNTDDNDNDHSNNLQSDSDSASEVDSSNSVPITPIDIFPSSVIFNNDNRNNNNNSPLPLLPITYTTSITTAIIDDDNSNTVPQRSLHDIIINGGTKRLFTTLESVIEAPAATTVPTTATSNSAPSPPSSSSTNISESTSTTASPPTTTATLSNINNNNCNNGNGSGYDLSNLLIQNAVQALSQISDPIIPVNITSNFTTNVMLMMMNGNCNNNNYTIDPKIITTTRPPPIVPNIITNFSKNAIDNNNIVINCNDLNNDRSFSIISPPLETPELVSSGCDSSGSSNNNDKRKRKLNDDNEDDEDYVPPTEKKIKKKSGRKPRSSNKSKRNKKQPMVNSGLATSSYSYSSPSTTSTTGHVTNNHTEGAKRKRVECQAPVSNKRISVVVNESQHGFAAADLRQQPLAQAVAITPIDIFPSSVIFNNDNRNNNNNSPLPLLPITYTTSITTAIIDDDNSNTVPQRSLHDIIINGGTKRLFTTLESVIEAPAATTVPTTATSNSAPSPPSSSSTNISESTSTTASPPTTTATLSNINNNNCNNGNGSGYDLSNLLIQNAVQALSQISDPIIPVNITSNFTTNVMLMMMNGNCNNNNYTIDPKIITTTRPPPIVPNIITNFSKNAIDNNNIVINCNDLNNDRSFSIISPPLETPELVSSGCDSSGSSNNNDKRKRKLNDDNEDDEDYVPPTEKKIKKKSGRKPRSSNKSKRNKKQPMVNSGLATSSYSYSSPSTTSTTGHVTNNHTEGAKRKRVECQAPVSNKRISVVVNESQHGFAAADLRQQPLAQAVASGIDWCRYCGTTEGVNWRPGPWGKRTLCKTPRLDLSSFASESIADRRQPVLQLYCWVCFENESYKGDHLISCGGCPKAYHQSCLEVPTTEQAVAGGAGAWYCGEGCKNNYNNKKIVVELPRKKMPLMLDPKNQGVEGPVTSASRSQASRRSSRT